MRAQYFNWCTAGMRFASERRPNGPMQYVRADEYDRLLHEVERLRVVADEAAKNISVDSGKATP